MIENFSIRKKRIFTQLEKALSFRVGLREVNRLFGKGLRPLPNFLTGFTWLLLAALFIYTVLSPLVGWAQVASLNEQRGEERITVTTTERGEREKLVSLNLRQAAIVDVLRLLSQQYKLNIVAGDEVTGLISLRLTNVGLEEALTAILVANGYDYERKGNIIRVAKAERLAEERKTRAEKEELEPLITEVIVLNYLDATDVKKTVEPLLSSRGKVSVLIRKGFRGFRFGSQLQEVATGGGGPGGVGLVREMRGERAEEKSRTLLITDIRSNLETIKKVIQEVDTQPKQILIDAKILEVEKDSLEDIGFQLTRGEVIVNKGDTNITNLINQGTTAATFPSSTTQGLRLSFSKLGGEDLVAVMHLLLQNDNTKTLSSPRILVLDNQEAAILVGEQYPILESTVTDQGTATESLSYFQPIGISLQVIPQITADNNINMVIHPTVSSVGATVTGTTGLQQPRINVREADTQVLIKNGETLVIGGLLEDVEIERVYRVPFLGYIPFLGIFFRRTQSDIDQRNLLIFITPSVVEPDEGLRTEEERRGYTGIIDPDQYGTLQERRYSIRQHLKEAIKMYDRKKYDQAWAKFQRILRLDPSNHIAIEYLRKIKKKTT